MYDTAIQAVVDSRFLTVAMPTLVTVETDSRLLRRTVKLLLLIDKLVVTSVYI